MNVYMLAGTVTGIIVGLIIAAVLMRFTKKNKKEKFTYDERQKALRGEGFKYAFYVLIIYDAAYACLNMALEKPWAEDMAGIFIGICLSLIVLIVYCIWHDCYFSMNEEPKKVLLFFGVISLINVIIAVMQGVNGMLIEDGMLTNQSVNLIVAIMFGIILLALAIRTRQKKGQVEEED